MRGASPLLAVPGGDYNRTTGQDVKMFIDDQQGQIITDKTGEILQI